jgi:hypothetical protein
MKRFWNAMPLAIWQGLMGGALGLAVAAWIVFCIQVSP